VGAFNGHPQLFSKEARLATVINVAVCQKDFFNRHARVFSMCPQFIQVTPRINKRRLTGLGANNQRAVLLELRDGNNFNLHAAIIAEPRTRAL
jgi:hypothetical protein